MIPMRQRLASMQMDEGGHHSDNIAIAIASYYDSHLDRPDNDPIDDELGWGVWVIERTDSVLDRLAAEAERMQDE